MKLKIDYQRMFDASDRSMTVKTAMHNVNAHRLAGIVEAMPELPELLNEKFEVEV
jgi:hypothetical protein